MNRRALHRGAGTPDIRAPGDGAPGFTLIEVLIAMAITAMVATLSFASLSSTMDSVETLRSQGERISEMNRAWSLMSRDLSHFVERPVRNEFGSIDPALFGGELTDQSLSLTRIGWHNTAQRTRSNMQRVRYVLEDETLYRESFLVLDRTGETEPYRVPLIENVLAMELRFLSPGIDLRDGEFDTDDWPESWGVGTGGGGAPPQAVEIRLELEDWGEVRWMYELPSA